MTDAKVGSAKQKNDSSEDVVLYRVEDGVATITLNRPEKLNAFNDGMVVRLAEVLRQFDVDGTANVAIILGAGRAFSSGADVRQRQMRSREEFEQLGGRASGWNADAHELMTRCVNWKPVITAPHGFAVGMGLGLCLDSDLIVAEEGTKFQVTEVKRGLAGSRYYALLNFRGAGSFAAEAALTGRFFTAEEALAAGVISRVAPKGEAHSVAMELARQINENPPLGVRAAVRTRRFYLQKLELEVTMYYKALNLTLTEDFAESARAFAEKRKGGPYKGR